MIEQSPYAQSPYAKSMGIEIARDAANRLILTMGFDATKMGRPGFLHGGAISGLLEAVA
jgi:acyl-coenzyme A thioesterase PaaI-like protein